MPQSDFQIDYTSARGSNTGDEYHELWAARQALRLLDTGTRLSAVTVEGLTTKEGTDKAWDGVDCSLLFGDEAVSKADSVEIQQLKYSASDPTSSWTVSRLCTGDGGKATTSPIRRLAKAFKGLVGARPDKPADTLRIRLVSNQPISVALVAAVEEAWSGVPPRYSRAWKPGLPDLHRLVRASGLSPQEFESFAKVLDLQGSCGSRFAMEEGMLKSISEWTDAELKESASRLREYIRKRMLPEAAGELITREKILIQFGGISDDYALFPCPSKIDKVSAAVPRVIATEVVERMKAGVQHLCLHGAAGVGKTTTLQEIESLLPESSLMVTFDCYGAGSYLDASALRHRTQDAFVQLANEIANRLRLPLLLVPQAHRNYPRAFRNRLDLAASAMASTAPEGLLVVTIDAADNSVLAAQTRSPPENSFVHDLVTLSGLPANVRILVSARTRFVGDLRLAPSFEKCLLPAFARAETAVNVDRHLKASATWIDDFHHFSGGIPRVQAYAFGSAGASPGDALGALLPSGKDLDQVFREQLQFALKKNASQTDVAHFCAGLISLPRPIPIRDLAVVLNTSEGAIEDLCNDLAPGIRSIDGLLSFADEDFERFVRYAAGSATSLVNARMAEHFLERAGTDAYAALNLAPALFTAGRRKDLLELVEREPVPPAKALPDPIRRREVHLQRLQTAIRVCREASDPAHALRFVLIGTEASKTEKATLELFVKYPELTSRFARSTASRLVLGDARKTASHGPLLLHLLAEDAARGDAISVREGRRRLRAWGSARRDDFEEQGRKRGYATPWPISPSDLAASLYATLLTDGPRAAVNHFRRLGARRASYSAGRSLVNRLLAEHKVELIEKLAELLPASYALFLLVPLAATGRPFDPQLLVPGLQQIQRRTKLRPELITRADLAGGTLGPWIVDTAIAAAELLISRKTNEDLALTILGPFLDPELRRIDKLNVTQHLLIDAILRAVTIVDAVAGQSTQVDRMLMPRPLLSEEERNATKRDNYASERDFRLLNLVGTFIGLYTTRARILTSPDRDKGSDRELFEEAGARLARDGWADQQHTTLLMRSKAAESIALMLASEVSPAVVLHVALATRQGWSSLGIDLLFYRLASAPVLHDALIESISQAATVERTRRTASEARATSLATYARLTAHLSPADAEAIFKWTVEVASELDFEIVDQLRLLKQMASQSHPQNFERGRSIAIDLGEVIHDAAIRLGDYDYFPWTECFEALSLLDYPAALASAARWHDSGIADIGDTGESLLTSGLKTKSLTSIQAAALAGLLQGIDGMALLQIGETAEREGKHIAQAMAEELARDCLLGRFYHVSPAAPFIERHSGGYWARRLQATHDFERSLSSTAELQPKIDDFKAKDGKPLNRDHGLWDEATLIDAHLLGTEIRKFKDSNKGRGFFSIETFLYQASDQVPPRLRVAHLEALLQVDATWSNGEIVSNLLVLLKRWEHSPAVVLWRDTHIADLVSSRLFAICRYLPHQESELHSALSMVRSAGAIEEEVLLHGLELNFERFSPSSAFAVIGHITERLESKQVSELCAWYSSRLAGRIDPSDGEDIQASSLPATVTEALGRFFYSFLGDIDVRIRWRCAHSLRRLARMNDEGVLDAVIARYPHREEFTFRASTAPFYWVAARLWLVIALDRVSLESPGAVGRHSAWLANIALDSEFPHLLVQDFARDACQKLRASGHLHCHEQIVEALAQVNVSPFPRSATERNRADALDGFIRHRDGLRFHFDGLDTLPRWYDPLLQSFANVTAQEFLITAERWIVDEWSIVPGESIHVIEPRPRRFGDRNWSLSSHSHGVTPTLENLQTYLEWNAMWCTAGQLLRTSQLAGLRYGEDEFTYRIRSNKLTEPPLWLSDLSRPPPLQRWHWQAPAIEASEWIENVSDDELVAEFLPSDCTDYVVVHAHIADRSAKHEQTTRVSSALVSPSTAHALVRALQTASDSSDFYICPEGHDHEIDEVGFKMTGWLTAHYEDSLLDSKDVFGNSISRIDVSPGSSVTTLLGLQLRSEPEISWYCPGHNQPSFVYEAWGSQEGETEPGRRYGTRVDSSGHRLMVRKEILAEFLSEKEQDLILEVEIKRREPRKAEPSDHQEDTREVEFERLFLLRRDGSIQAAERDFGAWRSTGP